MSARAGTRTRTSERSSEKKEKNDVVELYYDFQKAYDNVNHRFLDELMEVYGFPLGFNA